jgi:hypothetical protein
MNTQYYKLLTGKLPDLEKRVNRHLKTGFVLHGATFATGFKIGDGYRYIPEFAQAVVFSGSEEEIQNKIPQ